jgi:membrane protease YdiL (CAAX protease family)
VIAFGTVWILLLPVVLARNGIGWLPFTVPDVAFALIFISATIAGPTGGAFAVTAAVDGKPGVRALLRRYIQWRVGIQWYLLAIFGPIVLMVLALSVVGGMEPLRRLAANWQLMFTSFPLLLLSMFLFPALIEEPGWRGFALPRLQAGYGPLAGTVILGFLHGLWHLPVYFLVSGPAAMGPFSMTHVVINTINIMFITIFWTWVFNNARGSILIAILLHAANNADNQVLSGLIPRMPPHADLAVFTATVIAALVIVVATRGRLGYRQDRLPLSAATHQPQKTT